MILALTSSNTSKAAWRRCGAPPRRCVHRSAVVSARKVAVPLVCPLCLRGPEPRIPERITLGNSSGQKTGETFCPLCLRG